MAATDATHRPGEPRDGGRDPAHPREQARRGPAPAPGSTRDADPAPARTRDEGPPPSPGAGPRPCSSCRAVRGRAAPYRSERCSGGSADHVRLRALLALRDLELDPLTLLQGAVTVHLDRAVVDEYIRTTVDRDEAVALLRVEPLDGALSHA
ncbi:putative cold shock protein [Streptomyces sp. Tu6071]|nr:putative cold shock protein [Streptomyces sp. Tu6071]